ncbi:hypothetical protein [Clostridium chrysemydis]|uniref:hypothetical protein n=1 Tax=Clostridium chrysemydis TaxID=2665504 RepID=UPI001884416F|nr:hypothetical protein [Clostridium chrysemydis]
MKKFLLVILIIICTIFVTYTKDLNKAKDMIDSNKLNNLISDCLKEQANLSNSSIPTFEEHALIGTRAKTDKIIAYVYGFSMSFKVYNNTAYDNSGGEFIGTITLSKINDKYIISSYNFPASTADAKDLFKGSYKSALNKVDTKSIKDKVDEKAINYFKSKKIYTSKIKDS